MAKPRDISEAQARKILEGHGFTWCAFLGYWNLPKPFESGMVSWLNAGENNRARVAYMLAQLDRREREATQASR